MDCADALIAGSRGGMTGKHISTYACIINVASVTSSRENASVYSGSTLEWINVRQTKQTVAIPLTRHTFCHRTRQRRVIEHRNVHFVSLV
jgi:hypothetical protein